MRCCSTRTITNRSASSGGSGATGPEFDALLELVNNINTNGLLDAPIIKNNIGLTGTMLGYVSKRSVSRVTNDVPSRTFTIGSVTSTTKFVFAAGTDTPSTDDEYYTGYYLKSGGENVKIIAYDGATQTATTDSTFSITPNAGDVAEVRGGIYVGMIYDETLDKITFATYDPLFHRDEIVFKDVDIGPIDLDTIEVKHMTINDLDANDKYIIFSTNSVPIWKFYTEATTTNLITEYIPTSTQVVLATSTSYVIDHQIVRLMNQGTQVLDIINDVAIVQTKLLSSIWGARTTDGVIIENSAGTAMYTQTDKGSATINTTFNALTDPMFSLFIDTDIDSSVGTGTMDYKLIDIVPNITNSMTVGDRITGINIDLSSYTGTSESLHGLEVTLGPNVSGLATDRYGGIFTNDLVKVSIASDSIGVSSNKPVVVQTSGTDQGFIHELDNTTTDTVASFTSQITSGSGINTTALNIIGQDTAIVHKESLVDDAVSVFKYDTTNYVDITAIASDPGNSTLIYDVQNGVVYVGVNRRIDSVAVSLDIVSSDDVGLTVQYFDGTDWMNVTGLVDTTLGFTTDGEISWDGKSSVGEVQSNLGGAAAFMIWTKFIRTSATVTTPPYLSTIRVLYYILEEWDASGNLSATNLYTSGTVHTNEGFTDLDAITPVPLADSLNTTLDQTFGQTSLLGTINADTISLYNQYMSGFLEWDNIGPYYDEALLESTGVFRILVGGTGYVFGKKVHWDAPQDTIAIPYNDDHYIGVDDTGTVVAITDHTYMHINLVNLWFVMRDPTGFVHVYKENHAYGIPPILTIFNTVHIGSVISDSGVIPTRITTGLGSVVTDRQLTIDGDGTMADSGLITIIKDTLGVPAKFLILYMNASGVYQKYKYTDVLEAIWNNNGVIEQVPSGEIGVMTLGVGKDNINSDITPFILIVHTEWFTNNRKGRNAINDGRVVRINKVYPNAEIGQIGFINMRRRAVGDYVRYITIEKTVVGGIAVIQSIGSVDAAVVAVDTDVMTGIFTEDESSVQLALEVVDKLPVNATGVITYTESHTIDEALLTFTVVGAGSGYIKTRKVEWLGNMPSVTVSINTISYIGIDIDGNVSVTFDTETAYIDNIPLYIVFACLTSTGTNHMTVVDSAHSYNVPYLTKINPPIIHETLLYEQNIHSPSITCVTNGGGVYYGDIFSNTTAGWVSVDFYYTDSSGDIRFYDTLQQMTCMWSNAGTVENMIADQYCTYTVYAINGSNRTVNYMLLLPTSNTYVGTQKSISQLTYLTTYGYYDDIGILKSLNAQIIFKSIQGVSSALTSVVTNVYNQIFETYVQYKQSSYKWNRYIDQATSKLISFKTNTDQYYESSRVNQTIFGTIVSDVDRFEANSGNATAAGEITVYGKNSANEMDPVFDKLGVSNISNSEVELTDYTASAVFTETKLNAPTPINGILTARNQTSQIFTIENTGNIVSTSGAQFVEDVRTEGAFYAGTGTTKIDTDSVSTSGNLSIIADTGLTTGKSINLGGTALVGLKIDVDTGDTLANTNLTVNDVTTVHGGLADTDVTVAIPFGDPINTTIDNALGQTSVVGAIDACTYGINDEHLSGFYSWDGPGPYYDEAYLVSDNKFRILVSGTGYVYGKRIQWTAPIETGVITQAVNTFIGIDSTGTLIAGTDHLALHRDQVNLWYVQRSSIDGYMVFKETHIYGIHPDSTIFNTLNFGPIVSVSGAMPTILTASGGGLITDRQVKMVGNGVLYDSTLTSTIPDSGGVPIDFIIKYQLPSSEYITFDTTNEVLPYWNNAGVPELVGNYDVVVYTFGVGKDDLNNPGIAPYYLYMHDGWFTNMSRARDAVADGTIRRVLNITVHSEMGQIGFLLVRMRGGTNSDVKEIIIEKSSLGLNSVAQVTGSSSAALTLTDTTTFNGILSVSEENVQTSLNIIDDIPVEATGIVAWTVAGGSYTYDPSILEFTLTSGGIGYISKRRIIWLGTQSITLTAFVTSYICIDSTGTLVQTTDITEAHSIYIPLYIAYPDSATTANIILNDYSYKLPYEQVLSDKNNNASITDIIQVISYNDGISDDTLGISNEFNVNFYGILTNFVATAAVTFNMYFLNSSSNWELYASSTNLEPIWNDGTAVQTLISDEEQTFFPVYLSRAGEYIAIIQDTNYNLPSGNVTPMYNAIHRRTFTKPSGELEKLELFYVFTVSVIVVSTVTHVIAVINETEPEENKLSYTRTGTGAAFINNTEIRTVPAATETPLSMLTIGSSVLDLGVGFGNIERDIQGMIALVGPTGPGVLMDSINHENSATSITAYSQYMRRDSSDAIGNRTISLTTNIVNDDTSVFDYKASNVTQAKITAAGEIHGNIILPETVTIGDQLYADYPTLSDAMTNTTLDVADVPITFKLLPGEHGNSTPVSIVIADIKREIHIVGYGEGITTLYNTYIDLTCTSGLTIQPNMYMNDITIIYDVDYTLSDCIKYSYFNNFICKYCNLSVERSASTTITISLMYLYTIHNVYISNCVLTLSNAHTGSFIGVDYPIHCFNPTSEITYYETNCIINITSEYFVVVNSTHDEVLFDNNVCNITTLLPAATDNFVIHGLYSSNAIISNNVYNLYGTQTVYVFIDYSKCQNNIITDCIINDFDLNKNIYLVNEIDEPTYPTYLLKTSGCNFNALSFNLSKTLPASPTFNNVQAEYTVNGVHTVFNKVYYDHTPDDHGVYAVTQTKGKLRFFAADVPDTGYDEVFTIRGGIETGDEPEIWTPRINAGDVAARGSIIYAGAIVHTVDVANVSFRNADSVLVLDSSTINDKFNIRDVSIDPLSILDAPLVVYDRFDRNDTSATNRHKNSQMCTVNELGYIADKLDLTATHAVSRDKEGRPSGLNLNGRLMYLTELCRKQQQTIEMLSKHLRLQKEWDAIWGEHDNRVKVGTNVDNKYDAFRK